jgi:hypothetical protein
MLSRWLRVGLVLSALLGLGSCELNPQPDLPGSTVGTPNGPGGPVVGSGGTGLDLGNGGMSGSGSVALPSAGMSSSASGGGAGVPPLTTGGEGGETAAQGGQSAGGGDSGGAGGQNPGGGAGDILASGAGGVP